MTIAANAAGVVAPLDEREDHGDAERGRESEAAREGSRGRLPAADIGASAGEVEKASAAERERRQGLDGAERDPGRQRDLRADAVCLQRERDGGARDADVARA